MSNIIIIKNQKIPYRNARIENITTTEKKINNQNFVARIFTKLMWHLF